jgi:hypothetical protein
VLYLGSRNQTQPPDAPVRCFYDYYIERGPDIKRDIPPDSFKHDITEKGINYKRGFGFVLLPITANKMERGKGKKGARSVASIRVVSLSSNIYSYLVAQ